MTCCSRPARWSRNDVNCLKDRYHCSNAAKHHQGLSTSSTDKQAAMATHSSVGQQGL